MPVLRRVVDDDAERAFFAGSAVPDRADELRDAVVLDLLSADRLEAAAVRRRDGALLPDLPSAAAPLLLGRVSAISRRKSVV